MVQVPPLALAVKTGKDGRLGQVQTVDELEAPFAAELVANPKSADETKTVWSNPMGFWTPQLASTDAGINLSLLSPTYIKLPTPTCFKLLPHWARLPFSFAEASTGSNKAARMAMMAMTTNSSMSVKPPGPGVFLIISFDSSSLWFF